MPLVRHDTEYWSIPEAFCATGSDTCPAGAPPVENPLDTVETAYPLCARHDHSMLISCVELATTFEGVQESCGEAGGTVELPDADPDDEPLPESPAASPLMSPARKFIAISSGLSGFAAAAGAVIGPVGVFGVSVPGAGAGAGAGGFGSAGRGSG
jgi:hypothetical protein